MNIMVPFEDLFDVSALLLQNAFTTMSPFTDVSCKSQHIAVVECEIGVADFCQVTPLCLCVLNLINIGLIDVTDMIRTTQC